MFYINRRDIAIVIPRQLLSYGCLSPWIGTFHLQKKGNALCCFKAAQPKGNRVRRDLSDFPSATLPVLKQGQLLPTPNVMFPCRREPNHGD